MSASRTGAYRPVDPSTPIHSPHGSTTSTATRSRTPGQLSLHEYRRQQHSVHSINTPPEALPAGHRTIRRKVAVLSLQDGGGNVHRTGPPTAPPTPGSMDLLFGAMMAAGRDEESMSSYPYDPKRQERRHGESGEGTTRARKERVDERGRNFNADPEVLEAEETMRHFLGSRERRRVSGPGSTRSLSRSLISTEVLRNSPIQQTVVGAVEMLPEQRTRVQAQTSALNLQRQHRGPGSPSLEPHSSQGTRPQAISSYSAVAYPASVAVTFDPSPPPSPASPLLSRALPHHPSRSALSPEHHSPLADILSAGTPSNFLKRSDSSSSSDSRPYSYRDSFHNRDPRQNSPYALGESPAPETAILREVINFKPIKKLPKPSAATRKVGGGRTSTGSAGSRPLSVRSAGSLRPRGGSHTSSYYAPLLSDLIASPKDIDIDDLASQHPRETAASGRRSFSSLLTRDTFSREQPAKDFDANPPFQASSDRAGFATYSQQAGERPRSTPAPWISERGLKYSPLPVDLDTTSFSDLIRLYGSSHEIPTKENLIGAPIVSPSLSGRSTPEQNRRLIMKDKGKSSLRPELQSKNPYHRHQSADTRGSHYGAEFDSQSILEAQTPDPHGRLIGATDYQDCVDEESSGLNQILEAYATDDENLPMTHRSAGVPPRQPPPPLPFPLPALHHLNLNEPSSSIEKTTNYGDTLQLLAASGLPPVELPRHLDGSVSTQHLSSGLGSLFSPDLYEQESSLDYETFSEDDHVAKALYGPATDVPAAIEEQENQDARSQARTSGGDWLTTRENSEEDMLETMAENFPFYDLMPQLQTNINRRQINANVREVPSPHSTIPEMSIPSLVRESPTLGSSELEDSASPVVVNFSRLQPVQPITSPATNESSLPVASSVYSQDLRQLLNRSSNDNTGETSLLIGQAVTVPPRHPRRPVLSPTNSFHGPGFIDPAILSSEPPDGDLDASLEPPAFPAYRESAATDSTQWEHLYKPHPAVDPLSFTKRTTTASSQMGTAGTSEISSRRRSLDFRRLLAVPRTKFNEKITTVDKNSGKRHSMVLGQNKLMDLEMGKLSPTTSGAAAEPASDETEDTVGSPETKPSSFSVFRRASARKRAYVMSPLEKARQEQRDQAHAYHMAYPREQRVPPTSGTSVAGDHHGRLPLPALNPKASSLLTRPTSAGHSRLETSFDSGRPFFDFRLPQPGGIQRPETALSSRESDVDLRGGTPLLPLPLFHRPRTNSQSDHNSAVPRPLQLAALYPELQQHHHHRNTSSTFTPPTMKFNRILSRSAYKLEARNTTSFWGYSRDEDPALASLRKWSLLYLIISIMPPLGLLYYGGAFDALVTWHVRRETGREVMGVNSNWRVWGAHVFSAEVVVVLVGIAVWALVSRGGA